MSGVKVRAMRLALRLLTFGACALVLASCASGSGFNPFSQLYEQISGKFLNTDSAQKALAEAPAGAMDDSPTLSLRGVHAASIDYPVEAPNSKRIVSGVLDELIAEVPGPVPEIELVVTSSQNYGAFASANNTIYLNQGLLSNIESDDELAGVLAHELGHIVLDHFERAEIIEDRKRVAGVVLEVAALTASIAADQGGESVANTALEVAAGTVAADLVATSVFDSGWSRSQEDEADLFAVDLLVRAGYSPEGFVVALDRIDALDERQVSVMKQIDEAVQRRAQAALASGKLDVAVDTVFAGMFKALGATAGELFKRVSRQHADPDARRENVGGYVSREYWTVIRDKRDVAVVALRGDQEEQGRFRRNALASNALAAAAEGRKIPAAAAARKALTGPDDPNPHARLALFFSLQENDPAQAREHLEVASHGDHAPARIYNILATSYALTGATANALHVLERGDQSIGDPAPFLPTRVAVLSKSGNDAEVTAVLERCEQVGGETLLKRCKQQLPGA